MATFVGVGVFRLTGLAVRKPTPNLSTIFMSRGYNSRIRVSTAPSSSTRLSRLPPSFSGVTSKSSSRNPLCFLSKGRISFTKDHRQVVRQVRTICLALRATNVLFASSWLGGRCRSGPRWVPKPPRARTHSAPANALIALAQRNCSTLRHAAACATVLHERHLGNKVEACDAASILSEINSLETPWPRRLFFAAAATKRGRRG